MAKKSLSKLLSVILTIAICATSIFGCVIAVNAAESATYTIGSADVKKEDTEATVQLSFNAPQGMASVSFVVDNVGGWYSAVSVGFAGATDTNGTALSESDGFVITAEQIEGASDYLVIVEHQASVNDAHCTELVLNLTFTFEPLTETQAIIISDIEAYDIYGDEITFTGTGGELNTGCEHVYQVSGDPVYTDDTNGYEVYSIATCTLCGETKDGYQVVPVVVSDNSGISSFTAYDDDFWLEQVAQGVTGKSADDPFIVSTAGQFASVAAARLTAPTKEEITDNGYTVLQELAENSTDDLYYWADSTRDTGYYLDTDGLYFEVADGMTDFYMNGDETVANLTNAADVKAWFEDPANSKAQWWAAKDFKGTFDGNGVTVYGIYCTQLTAGTFHFVSGATIKNLAVKNSYFNSSNIASPIVGAVQWNRAIESQATLGSGEATIAAYETITVEGCTAANNYVATTGTSYGPAALIGETKGTSAGGGHYVNNCLVYGNTFDNQGSATKTGLIAGGGNGTVHLIENVVSLGIRPYSTGGGWYMRAIDNEIFKNIFTDQSFESATNYSKANCAKWNLNTVTPEQMLGANAATTTAELTAANKAARDEKGYSFLGADLDWNTADNPDGIWCVGEDGEYPTLLNDFDTETADATTSDAAWKLLAVNIEYEDSGNFALNFHYAPPYTSQDAALYVPNAASASGFMKLTEAVESPYADGTILPVGAMMFSIPNISAKDIDILWLPTIVATAEDGSGIVYGATEQISVEDYATKVITGEAVYANSTTDDQKTKDINVAAALINYGYAAKDALASTTVTVKEPVAVSYNGKVTTVELLDSTQPNSESNPYIINDPGQIFALSRDELTYNGSVVGTNHEYFKVADGIDAFYINGGETVANLETVTEVVNYFKDNPGSEWWSKYDAAFNGSFDGNGVIIYGLYSDGGSAGLFPYSSANSTTDAPQTIKNITVKNSYLTGSSAAGAIIGNIRGTAGSTIIENCTSTNNYISSTNTSSNMTGGALVGSGYGALTVNNCLVYGNIVENSYATDYDKNVLLGHSRGSTYITNVIALGVTPWNLAAPYSQNHIDKGNFVNVFTDQDIQPLLAFETSTNTETNANKYNINGSIEPADLQGANAAAKTAELTAANKAARDEKGYSFLGADLDWNNIWLCGAEGSYPSIVLAKLSDTGATYMPDDLQAQYDALVLDNYDEYGETDPLFSMYASSLNLKTNPYIAFTFAFGGDYKTNRDNIEVTFTTASDTITTTVGDNNGGVSAGWTNAATAGRYHLYKLEGISVEDMCKGIEVNVSYSNQTYTFGTFSVEGFALEAYKANRILPCEYYATRYEAAKALLFYTQMVNERYGA